MRHSAAVKHVFLTGDPGVGKSTIVSDVRSRLATAVAPFGFATFEQRDPQGSRTGFRSINIAHTSDSVQLASLEHSEQDSHRIGPFHVHLDDAVAFYRRVLSPEVIEEERPRLCFLDEIGAMQLLSPELEQVFGSIIDGSHHCLGTLPSKGLHNLAFVEALRDREDVRVIEVTHENRNSLVDVVCSLLYGVCFSPNIAQSIEAKVTLARRYATELDARLEQNDGIGLACHFLGEHGMYELKRGSLEETFSCTCPFFSELGTCSHTLALALEREQQWRAKC